MHVEHVQSVHEHVPHSSLQFSHWHVAWLHVAQLQSAHVHWAHTSVQFAHSQVEHSS